MSTSLAIQKYSEVTKYVFSEQKLGWQDGKFKASKLEDAIRKVLVETLGPGREEEKMLDNGIAACKT